MTDPTVQSQNESDQSTVDARVRVSPDGSEIAWWQRDGFRRSWLAIGFPVVVTWLSDEDVADWVPLVPVKQLADITPDITTHAMELGEISAALVRQANFAARIANIAGRLPLVAQDQPLTASTPDAREATIEQASAVMRGHYLSGDLDVDRNYRCVCGRWSEGPMEPGWDDHLARELADAGLLRPLAVATDEATVERVDRLALLLYLLHVELHPVYGNTSRRGRGIGGQMVTQQCSVIAPEGAENAVLAAIEDEYRGWFRAEDEAGRDPHAKLAALRAALAATGGAA